MDILRFLHSWTRWAVVIAAVLIALYFLLAFLQRRSYNASAARIMTIFSSLVGLQWVIGLVFFVVWGLQFGFNAFGRYNWEHLFAMTIAVLVAHAHMGWRRKEGVRLNLNNVLVIAGVFVVIFLGITVLPDPIEWRFYVPGG